MRIRTAVALLVVIAVGGCSSDDDADSSTSSTDAVQVRTVPVPPERLTPFCQAIADLDRRLDEAGPDDDTGDMIIETYSSIVDEVPAEIRDDFLSVLAALQAGTPATSIADTAPASTGPASSLTGTTLEDFEEGYTPDDSPALRVNSFVQFTCRDNENNPGPADTQPAVAIASTTPS